MAVTDVGVCEGIQTKQDSVKLNILCLLHWSLAVFVKDADGIKMYVLTNLIHSFHSQSVSNSWQTVADHVKTTEFTVKDLRPNTVYLFIIRAVNAQGLGDPSPMSEPVRTQGTGKKRMAMSFSW